MYLLISFGLTNYIAALNLIFSETALILIIASIFVFAKTVNIAGNLITNERISQKEGTSSIEVWICDSDIVTNAKTWRD